MMIEGRDVQRQRLLVAEIGNNHEGDGQAAVEMVAAAAEAGADAVKVQIITPERLVHASQRERITQLSRFRLPDETYEAMAALARTRGMLFIATPFDVRTLEQFAPLLSAVKIASGDLDYTPLLAAAARTKKPLILSTGMGTMTEVSAAVRTIEQYLPADQPLESSLALLHCVSAYPTPLDQANLRALERLRVAFGLVVGYSDHTLGIEASLVAAALGARIIEKHFTLDKTRATFRDHALSADPQELRRLATILHTFDAMLGDGEKRPMPCEQPAVTTARRGAVAVRDLPAGIPLTLADLDFVRPRSGLPPAHALALIGRTVRTPLKQHEFVLEHHLSSVG
ncbi:MAG TPA: N-acetylneuraminate synthase family protein [Methylomirabilota bacterium]|jgi:N-acetylneuraminate synthase/N,N'-diacetyllegionaminate synthase|nr:N-acetylneuraminate synthase family protein [Methylomirabilota bacterium]